MSRNIIDNIKKHANSDYRAHGNGIVCRIFAANQVAGMGSTLTVAPISYDLPQNETQSPRKYSVIPIGSAGVYGYPKALCEAYYAYVFTDNISKIEGKPAAIIPKSALLSNPGSDYANNPNIISSANVISTMVRKENNIVSSKYS